MKIQQDLMFIGCNKYDFKDESTGRQISGCKVDLVSPDLRKGESVHGYEAVTMAAPFELFFELYKLKPLQVYRFDVEIEITKKGAKSSLLGVVGKQAV